MAPIPRGQHLPKATETKAKPGPMPFLGHVHTEPSVGGDLAGAWAAGWEVKAATQGDACKQDTSGMQASLAFRGVLQLQYLSAHESSAESTRAAPGSGRRHQRTRLEPLKEYS